MFDEPNLVSAAGRVPIVKLASEVGLRSLADRLCIDGLSAADIASMSGSRGFWTICEP